MVTVTGWLVLCVAGVAGATALAVPSPAAVRRRVGRAGARGPRVPSILRPREGAIPLGQRLALAVPAALAVALAAGSLSHRGPSRLLPVAIPLIIVGVIALGRVESPAARRAREQLVRDLPQCWELLAACLAAGLPVRTAMEQVIVVQDGELADVLAEVLSRMRLGESEAAAWRSVRDHEQLGMAARDLARSAESGVVVAGLLDEYADQARQERRGVAEARAKAIGVWAVLPLMTCFLPAFLLVGVVPIVAGVLLPLLSGW